MRDRLRERGFDDLEPPHLIVLQYPGPHGSRPSDLAVQLQMSKQALNYLLGQLEARGYLERQTDPGDLRSKRIALTARGRSVIPLIREAVADVEADWAGRLGPERFAELRGLLVELNDVI